MKKILLVLAIMLLGMQTTSWAAFYQVPAQYQLIEDNTTGLFYVDKSTIQPIVETGEDALSFTLIAVPKNGQSIESTQFFVYYDKKNQVATYKVNTVSTLDSEGKVLQTEFTKGSAAMRRAIPRRSNLFYMVDACYEYLHGTRFYETK